MAAQALIFLLIVLVDARESKVDAQDVLQELPEALGLISDAQHAVLNVAQIAAHLGSMSLVSSCVRLSSVLASGCVAWWNRMTSRESS